MPQPWKTEPNIDAFVTRAELPGFIKRLDSSGALAGYVGVPRTHPLYESYYDTANWRLTTPVHGGLTYSGELKNMAVYLPGHYPKVKWSWFFGFDCAHYLDYLPEMPELGGEYRDIEYVRDEVENLAEQLAEMSKTIRT